MNAHDADRLAKILWNYQKIDDPLVKADCILALGSHDLRVAARAAEVYLQGLAPLIVMSGGVGRLTHRLWTKPEAEMFSQKAQEMGVPADHILLEPDSTNTGENIAFSKKLLEQKALHPKKIILVHKPYMCKRAYAAFKKIWPEPDLCVTSPQIPYEEYANEVISKEEMIHILVGDLQRVKEYPAKGFTIPLSIPPYVLAAYEELVKAGYTRHLIKN